MVILVDYLVDNFLPEDLLPLLEAKVTRYLGGVGHPRHPSIASLIEDVGVEADHEDKLYRVRRFVEVVSGQRLTPVDPKKRFVVSVSFYS